MYKCKVTLYVPSTYNKGIPLPPGKHESLVKSVSEQFANHFGGCTATDGLGTWKSESGALIQERITLVTSYHALETKDALAFVIPIAQVIKTRYGQEAIAIETEQGIQFV
jgi:hypothetical protein